MEINPNIFKAYDIRGVYPKEFNEEIAYSVGQAFIQFLKKENPKIVVGQDNRLSSPAIFKSLVKGIVEQGGNVIDIGIATTPMLYWAAASLNCDGGLNVTASHNPSQYNGLKLVREKAIPISGETGIQEIKKMVLEGKFKKEVKNRQGKITRKDILKDYLKFNLKDLAFEDTESLKIVIDTANAVSGILIPQIFKTKNYQVYHLFPELDGNFPNHNPDPLVKENLKAICQTVKKEKADLGIAFDGDGDRIIFVDEKGEAVSGDFITALISELILEETPGEKILYDIRSSNIVKETIEKNGGRAVTGRIGHSFIKEKMRRENIVFAGELSGHYYHKNHYFCECPLFVLFKVLEIISRTKKPFSEIIRPFQKYFYSGEINFEVENKEEILKRLEKNPPAGGEKGETLKIDGLRIDFKNFWFLVRPSNTEPLLRLVVEAKTKELLGEKIKELSALISS